MKSQGLTILYQEDQHDSLFICIMDKGEQNDSLERYSSEHKKALVVCG